MKNKTENIPLNYYQKLINRIFKKSGSKVSFLQI